MRSGYCDRGVKRDKVVKIARLSGCKNFVDERERERESPTVHCSRHLWQAELPFICFFRYPKLLWISEKKFVISEILAH